MIERQKCVISHITSAKQSVHWRESMHVVYINFLYHVQEGKGISAQISNIHKTQKKDSPINSTDLNYLEKMARMVNYQSRFLEQHLQIDPRTSGSSPLQVVNLSTFLIVWSLLTHLENED